MSFLTSLALQRRSVTILAIGLVLAAGVFTYQNLERELFPQIQFPNITIATAQERDSVYAHLRDELADPPIPTPEAIANFYNMALPHFPELKGYNPLQMWDLAIARRITDQRKG